MPQSRRADFAQEYFPEKAIMQGHLKFLDSWYEKVKGAARHKNAEKVLMGTAFLESSVFLLPVDALLIPMVQADHSKAWRYALLRRFFQSLAGLRAIFWAISLPKLSPCQFWKVWARARK